MRVVFPTHQDRATAGFPPLSATAWAAAKFAGDEQRLRTQDQVAFLRVRLAEQRTPPAIPTARGMLGGQHPTRELGRAMRQHGLLPGGRGERFISTFGQARPCEGAQAAWERWAAGILTLNGYTLVDAAEAGRHLAAILIGCRPPWLSGKPADIWRACWQASAIQPPRGWAHA